MSRKRHWFLLILVVILLGFPAGLAAQEKTPPEAAKGSTTAPPTTQAPAPTPDAKQILQQMCDFLKNQAQFSFKAEVYDDQVYAEGRKLQYGLEVEAFFKRPDKFRINGEGDLESKQLNYEGKTLTLYDQSKNQYGIIEVAGDIDAALDKASKDYGLHVGLAELGANHLAEHADRGLTNALYVGESKLRGVPCHHLAFDKKEVHYQLWVEAGDKPLLRKVVVTQKSHPYAPQWTAYLSDWNFAPQLAETIFTFSPPPGAQKVQFIPVKKAVTPAPQGIHEKKGGAS